MLKRVALLLFIIMYLSTSVGFAVNLHYCGKVLAEVKVNQPIKNKCCKSSEAKDKCCKSKHLNIKVADQQPAKTNTNAPSVAVLELLLPQLFLSIPAESVRNNETASNRAPPCGDCCLT